MYTLRKFSPTLAIVIVCAVLSGAAYAQCGQWNGRAPKLQRQSWKGAAGAMLRYIADGADDANGIVGYWRVTLTSKGNGGLGIPDGAVLDHGFAQWHSDNTELMNSNRVPNTGSFCMGVWTKVGPSKYKLNHFAMGFDDTVHQSYSNIVENIELSGDRDSFSGTFTIYNADINGNPGPTITGEITGKRVKVTTTIQDIL